MKKNFLRNLIFTTTVCATFCAQFLHAQDNPQPQQQLQVEDLEAKQQELLKKEQELLESIKKDLSKKPATKKESKKAAKETNKEQSNQEASAIKVTPTPAPTKVPQTPTPAPESCDDKLTKSSELVARLRKELDETRSRLAISETEVERLAYLLEDSNKLGGKKSNISASKQTSNSGLRVREPSEIQPKVDQDMPIATVTAEKAQLRTGPGMNNSPLMTVAKGTRLAIETRSGEWYRVIAPSGARAWVSADVIDFGGGAKIKDEPSYARNPGLSDSAIDPAEAAAFDAIIKGSKKP